MVLSTRWLPWRRWRRRLRTLRLALSWGAGHPRATGAGRSWTARSASVWTQASRPDVTPLDFTVRPQQGRFGDCWAVASMLAVHAIAPAVLEEMVRPALGEHCRSAGPEPQLWAVRLGGPRSAPVLIDRTMPLRDGRWAGARQSGDGPGWPGLLEKALVADLAGSYLWLQRGLGLFGLRALTGLHARTHLLLPSTAEIQRLLRSGHPVLASTHPLTPWVRAPQGPLPANHVFAVVGADPARGTVALRNPWRPDTVLTLERGPFRRAFLSVDTTLTPLLRTPPHRADQESFDSTSAIGSAV